MKGSMLMLIFTGVFLILISSYELYNFLKTNEFIYEFPGDWDQVMLIPVGIFLIIRSRKYVTESRSIFINISRNHLTYRAIRSEPIHKVALSDIKEIKGEQEEKGYEKIFLILKDSTKIKLKLDGKNEKRKHITESLINEFNFKSKEQKGL